MFVKTESQTVAARINLITTSPKSIKMIQETNYKTFFTYSKETKKSRTFKGCPLK